MNLLKRFWWIAGILVIGLLILIVTGIGGLKHDRELRTEEGQRKERIVQTRNRNSALEERSAKLEARAMAAISSGAAVTDATQDWMSTGMPGNNPSFYPYDPGDLKSLTFAADNDYLYIKIVVSGKMPTKLSELPEYDGDKILGVSVALPFDIDNNKNTGTLSDGGAEAMVVSYFREIDGLLQEREEFWYGATGIEQPETKRYAHYNGTIAGKWGGLGKDWKIIAVPLSEMGVKKGQTITVKPWVETNSAKYEHASFDKLFDGTAKDSASGGAKITL